MPKTNEKKYIKWHDTFKCKCRLDASACNNKERWNNDKCRDECKKWIGKGICNKEFICNPSNCECEYDKSCDVGKYLDCENCKCRTRLTDKLVEECSENELIYNNTLNDHKKVCNSCERSSCTIYIVSLSVFLTMNIGIGTVFIYFHRYSKNEVITNINHSTEKSIYWMQIH